MLLLACIVKVALNCVSSAIQLVAIYCYLLNGYLETCLQIFFRQTNAQADIKQFDSNDNEIIEPIGNINSLSNWTVNCELKFDSSQM
jgi:hypothetical protein